MRNVLLEKSLLLACVIFTCANSLAQVTEKWVQRQNGDANNLDAANALVVDQRNNVIVTGYSEGSGTGTDYATIKYNSDGGTKWVKRYNGPGNGEDRAVAIAVDTNCNVLVTGWSTGSGTGTDFATIKYDDDGNTKWVKRFNGPANGADQATAIAVDESGNVYVTGWSSGIGTGFDYTTIKYDKDGNTKWVSRYNGPGNGTDLATAIAVDDDGNVYITGTSAGSGTGGDYATIKYDKSGVQQWVQRFNGPVNSFDRASSLAVDNNGNVYVTGFITSVVLENSETDIATIKYNAAGVQQWAAIFNRSGRDEASAIAVDASGNVYLTGLSGTAEEDPDNDYVTLKYNTAGVQQWVSIFVSPGIEQSGGATDLVLDKAGNVYITGGLSFIGEGINYTTIKYNNNGVQQWVAIYNGPGNDFDKANAIGIDQNGNVYVTGQSNIDNGADYATIKYNSAGVQKWVRRYNGPGGPFKGGNDVANALAVDAYGNVHVTGGMTRLVTGEDYATFKYDPNANRIWKKTYNGTGNGPDEAADITLDAQGNVYATGRSFGSGTHYDYGTVKYDAAGNSKWGKRYNGPGNSTDQATAIAADENGNVYVTGVSIGTGDSFGDYATIKYDKDGNTKWVKRYDGPGHGLDFATAIAVDAAGNVYVTGRSIGSGTLEDYATIKYDANGNQLWVARYNGPDNSIDEANALAIDASGNVYVTGGSFGVGTLSDYATIKYNTAGVQQWVARYNVLNDIARDIAVDGAGNVYVTGASGNNGNLDDYATIKYNAAGIQQWAARYDAGNSGDEANALALDAFGNVYVTGGSRLNNNVFEDYATVKYNTAGIQQWVARYNGPGNSTDIATDIALDKDGNVIVTGRSIGNATQFDYATIKYEQTPLITSRSATGPEQNNGVIEQQEAAKLTVKAFPNAFTQFINLQWSGSDKPVHITITDAMGRLVEKRTGLAPSGAIRTGNNFPQGVYFAEIVQGTEKIMLKLVKN
jgi:uncharacterized delta-60 repeat protein